MLAKCICKIRLCNHAFPVEKGRYLGLEQSDRKCNICTRNCIGDEYRYFFKCSNPTIKLLRKTHLPQYYIGHPSMYKFVNLLKSVAKSRKVGIKVGKFCRELVFFVK